MIYCGDRAICSHVRTLSYFDEDVGCYKIAQNDLLFVLTDFYCSPKAICTAAVVKMFNIHHNGSVIDKITFYESNDSNIITALYFHSTKQSRHVSLPFAGYNCLFIENKSYYFAINLILYQGQRLRISTFHNCYRLFCL